MPWGTARARRCNTLLLLRMPSRISVPDVGLAQRVTEPPPLLRRACCSSLRDLDIRLRRGAPCQLGRSAS